MIRIKLLSRTNLNDEYAHSLLISLLRGLAALEVAAAHLRAHVYPGYSHVVQPGAAFQGLAFVTGFAHQAVVVFFILSGWLVGGSLLNKRSRDGIIKEYAIDRVTRLWIVLIPTLMLIVGFKLLTSHLSPQAANFSANNEYSVATFFGNLIGLQKILVPTFGGNFPLWSLSNETWYYVLFPLLVVIADTKSVPSRIAAILAAGGLAWLLGGPIILYFAIWLLGAAGSRIDLQSNVGLRSILFIAFAAVAVYFRLNGKNDDLGFDSFPQDLLFSVLFILLLTSMQVRLDLGRRAIIIVRRVAMHLANFSFTLYVIHMPLIGLSGVLIPYLADNRFVPNSPIHLLAYFGMFGVIVILAYMFHLPFEANTHRLRTFVKSNTLPARSSA